MELAKYFSYGGLTHYARATTRSLKEPER